MPPHRRRHHRSCHRGRSCSRPRSACRSPRGRRHSDSCGSHRRGHRDRSRSRGRSSDRHGCCGRSLSYNRSSHRHDCRCRSRSCSGGSHRHGCQGRSPSPSPSLSANATQYIKALAMTSSYGDCYQISVLRIVTVCDNRSRFFAYFFRSWLILALVPMTA